jgi:hypothetical protein
VDGAAREFNLAFVFEEHRRRAALRYVPTLTPYDTSLDAWLSLLGRLAVAADASTLLTSVGLQPAELGALHGRWSSRLAADAALAKQAREQWLAAPGELPPLVRGTICPQPPAADEQQEASGPDLAPENVLGPDVDAELAAAFADRGPESEPAPPLFVPLPAPKSPQPNGPAGAPSSEEVLDGTGELNLSAIVAAIGRKDLPFEAASAPPDPVDGVEPKPKEAFAPIPGGTGEITPDIMAAMLKATPLPFQPVARPGAPALDSGKRSGNVGENCMPLAPALLPSPSPTPAGFSQPIPQAPTTGVPSALENDG